MLLQAEVAVVHGRAWGDPGQSPMPCNPSHSLSHREAAPLSSALTWEATPDSRVQRTERRLAGSASPA
jgi:hypothetical protein